MTLHFDNGPFFKTEVCTLLPLEQSPFDVWHIFSQTSMWRVKRCQLKLFKLHVYIPQAVSFCYFRFENKGNENPDSNLKSRCIRLKYVANILSE
jgi:hypothetical protein